MANTTRVRPSNRRHFITGGILCVGWAVALIVYITSSPATEDFDVYDMEHSKKYLRQVEIIGGKAGLLANDLREWLAGLLHGQSLAYTIAVVTAIVALAAHLVQKRRVAENAQ
jgi:hypothetical protein